MGVEQGLKSRVVYSNEDNRKIAYQILAKKIIERLAGKKER